MVFWIIIYILIAILTMFILLRTTTESSVSNEDILILGILWPISYFSVLFATMYVTFVAKGNLKLPTRINTIFNKYRRYL